MTNVKRIFFITKEEEEKIRASTGDQFITCGGPCFELEDGTIIETPSGKFTVSHRRTWTYSDEVDSISESLKKQKKLEEQKGIAKYTTKPSVIFKSSGESES